MSNVETFYNSDDIMYNRLCEHAGSVLSICEIDYPHSYTPAKLRESSNTTPLFENIRYTSGGYLSVYEGVYITKQNFYMYLKKQPTVVNVDNYKMKLFFKGESIKEIDFFIKQITK